MSDRDTDQLLPDGFAALGRFVQEWALDNEAQRNQQRLASSMADIQDFYDTMLHHMEAVLHHLSNFKMQNLPPPERRLLHLALSLMEVAPAVEIYSSPDVPDAIEAHRFLIRSS